jgi:ferredoxin--NADP+ reductase
MARRLKELGNKVYGIVGARTKELLIFTDRLEAVLDRLDVTTNDGSQGLQGLVTDALKAILDREPVHYVVAVGPVPMMRAVSEMTRSLSIPTMVSLNTLMVDGTGMCGACRVTVGGETKFSCIHGPEFDGHRVDYDELVARQRIYAEKERLALEAYLNEREQRLCQA